VNRWSELKTAFWDLADLAPSDRAHRLALLASTDPELYRQLDVLLAADDRGEQLLHLFAAVAPALPEPPVRVGPYEITGVLGAGGMGEVYRARDPRLGREVAVKMLPAVSATDRRRLARFQQEARVLAALNHPNIAAIYGLEEASSDAGFRGPALILELVDGMTLAERIARASGEASCGTGTPGSPIEIPEALGIARQIVDALAAAQKKGIVHRDLKPANIKICPDGTVKVLDFGLAKAAFGDPAVAVSLRESAIDETLDGVVMGTVAYMSPEQARGEPTDGRTDIWAFGCVLYEMLTGRAPFSAGSVAETIAAVLERTPDWTALPDATPERIRRLLVRVLTKDRNGRLQDAEEAKGEILACGAQPHMPHGHLPVPASPLIGRHVELAEARELMRTHRCLTLTGPGGSGKTRLALRLAADVMRSYRDGVCWVPLEAVSDPALVLPEIARSLDVAGDLTASLRSKHLLIVLDNFEQVIASASQLAGLIAAGAGVRLLVTSREPLHIDGERVYVVEPLTEDEATALFTARAAVSEPQAAVREICRRVDCLPLAVELAAARTAILPPEQLLARFGERLALLTTRRRDSPARQQTLRATIQWSYDLLTSAEQTLFRRLAVFTGGSTFEAAERVVGADLDTLQVLVDRSLVRVTSHGRFQMLETIHEFASEQLAGDAAADDLRARHAAFFLELAERVMPHLREARQHDRLDELERDHPNLRSALSCSLAVGRIDWALRFCSALQFFWMYHSHFAAARRWVADALSADENTPGRISADRDPLRVTALATASVLATLPGDFAAAERHALECLELARRLGDVRNEAGALLLLGRPALGRGDHGGARQVLEQAMERAREAKDAWCAAMATFNLAYVALSTADFSKARRDMQASLDQFRQLQDNYGVARSYAGLGAIAVHSGAMADALAPLRESLAAGLALGDREGPAWALELMAAALAQRHPESAARLIGAAEELRETLGITLSGSEVEVHLRAISEIRAAIDDDRFQAVAAAGRSLGLADAVAFALEQTVRS